MKVNALNPFQSRAVAQELLQEMPPVMPARSFSVSWASGPAVGSCRNIASMLLWIEKHDSCFHSSVCISDTDVTYLYIL